MYVYMVWYVYTHVCCDGEGTLSTASHCHWSANEQHVACLGGENRETIHSAGHTDGRGGVTPVRNNLPEGVPVLLPSLPHCHVSVLAGALLLLGPPKKACSAVWLRSI